MMNSGEQLRLDFAAVSQTADTAAGDTPDRSAQRPVEYREFILKGLDGGNLLGFLAAVGALQSVTAMEPAGDWRMRWQQDDGPWHPTLTGNTALAPAGLTQRLADYLRDADESALKIGKNLTISPEHFRKCAKTAQDNANYSDHRQAAFIAAFGCENAADNKRQVIRDTALRTMAGAGHQHFLDTMLQTVNQTGSEHLYRSLFAPWERKDRRLGLRWDPAEARRYALRWRQPSSEPATTERGANRLAIEALPLLPTAISSGDRLLTTGFRQERRRGIYFSWPIWTCPAGIAAVTSAMRLAELGKDPPDQAILAPLGIAAVYRSWRVTEGKQRNFTPAIPV